LPQTVREIIGEKLINLLKFYFSVLGGRKQHIMFRHTETAEKKFVCDVCPAKFFRASDKRTHMKKHTGERINCQLCEKSFIHVSHLNQHMKTHTEGKRIFVCHHCDKTYAQRKALRNHLIVVHKEGELANKCEYCPYATEERSAFVNHMEKHHPGKEYTVAPYKRNLQFVDDRGKLIRYEVDNTTYDQEHSAYGDEIVEYDEDDETVEYAELDPDDLIEEEEME
jgi:hypothetical protein